VTTDEIYALFDGDGPTRAFLHSNTYTGNALGVAAALAALDVYAGEDFLANVEAGAAVLRAELTALVHARPFLRQPRAAGMMAAVDLAARDGSALDPRERTGRKIYREALARGALLRPLGDTMYLFPPLVATAQELREMVAVLAASIDAIC
jgi:adenosylmethionine-8-amino-7-oxononanoate aminotransferase